MGWDGSLYLLFGMLGRENTWSLFFYVNFVIYFFVEVCWLTPRRSRSALTFQGQATSMLILMRAMNVLILIC